MVVTESTARVEIFQSIYSIINSNKLSGTAGLATFPEKSPTFPCYVINPSNLTNDALALNMSSRESDFSMRIILYGDARDGTKKIDEMKDNIIDTLRNSANVSSLKTDKISIKEINDEVSSQSVYKNMKLNKGSLTIRGVLLI